MNITLVGGTWDANGGKASYFIDTLGKALRVPTYNGGVDIVLPEVARNAATQDVVLWFPNVPDSFPKDARDLKALNQKLLLVMSKANYADDHTHSFQDIIARALTQKANLVVEFQKGENGHKKMRLLDPLGNQWGDWTQSAYVLTENLRDRLGFLALAKRQGIDVYPVPDRQREYPSAPFLDVIRRHANTFHELLQPDPQSTRFLGNASFRCASGFPSFRSEDGSVVYVSRRNLDKRDIGADGFIPVGLSPQPSFDGGTKLRAYDLKMRKPSVDSPVQVRLYQHFPWARHMLHGHVYVQGTLFTDHCYPCGDLREVDEILRIAGDLTQPFALNLRGHGFIAVTDGNLSFLYRLKFEARPAPEIQKGA